MGTVEFKMPSLGADMESGILVEWCVAPGDRVQRGQVVAVVETDKGAIDVEIFHDGVVEALLVAPETDVPVGTALARLRVEGDAVETVEPVGAEPAAGTTQGPAAATVETRREEGAPEAAATTGAPVDASAPGRVKASPRARKRAAELGVSLRDIVGTGPGGSITGEDVERAATSAPAVEVPAPQRPRASGMRAAIAAAMSRSKREIPHYYLSHTVDLEPALRWLEARNATRPITERVLPIALVVRAVALALRDFPELCGWWRDGGFVPSAGIHVGLAVSLRDGGLVDPAIHDADRFAAPEELGALFERIRDVTKRARANQLRSSELSDAAITITNLGDQGVESVFGVITPPQVAIVGVGAVVARPWVVDGEVVARRVVTLSLSADHRVSDGHRGGRFLRTIEEHLQDLS